MRVAELFAGVGGMALGLKRAGCITTRLVEIDPFARRVLAAWFPGVPLGVDVRDEDGSTYEVDMVAGGSPCQGMSVAGKREGLRDHRSILFYEQIRIWRESGAELLLWENVYGALSSYEGRDFSRVLSTIVGCPIPVPRKRRRGPRESWPRAGVVSGPAGVASWRCLDAQYVGLEGHAAVPQRRLRVFVLGARTGRIDPAEVLLEPEGVFGDTPPRRKAGQGSSRSAGERAGIPRGGIDRYGINKHGVDLSYQRPLPNETDNDYWERMARHESAHGITPEMLSDGPPWPTPEAYGFNWQNGGGYGNANDGLAITPDGVGPLDRSTTKAVVDIPRAYSIGSHAGTADGESTNKSHASGGPTGFGIGEELANTVRAGRAQSVVAFNTKQDGHDAVEDVAPSLLAMPHDKSRANGGGQLGIVAFKPSHFTRGKDGAPAEVFPPLSADADRGDQEAVILAVDFAQITNKDNRSQPAQPAQLAPTLNAKGDIHVFNETGHEKWSEEPVAGSLNAHEAREAHTLITDREDARAVNISNGVASLDEAMGTLGVRSGGSEVGKQTRGVVLTGIPRRLMPVECERLMGWEDDWTNVPDAKGKPASDSQRYKACGNGVVAPVAQFIGERLLRAWNAQ